MLSDEAINNTIRGADVEQKVTDCLQDWAHAGSDAVQEMMRLQKLQDDSSREQFVISLIGNLAWAATVFFPPAAAATPFMTASRGVHLPPKQYFDKSGTPAIAKIVSVLGAAVGSNTLGQLLDAKSLDWPAVGDHLGELVPEIRKNLKDAADSWIALDLRSHMTMMFSLQTHPDYNKSNDDEYRNWYSTFGAGDELRKTVWERFVFPVSTGLEYGQGEQGLKKFLIRKLTDVKIKYELQYSNYMKRMSWEYVEYASSHRNPYTLKTYEEWVRRYPAFNFVVRLEGLPQDFMEAQDERLRDLQLRLWCQGCNASIPKDGDRIKVPGVK